MNDLGKAFTFPFKDPNWLSKLLVGALFLILSIFVVGIFIIAGYFVQTIQRVMRREENALPEWTDIGVMLVVGFKFCVVYLLYVVPILLIMTPVFAISILSALTADDSLNLFAGTVTMLSLVVVIPYAIAFTIILPIVATQFAVRESMADALDIATVFRLFKRNWQNTVIVALITLGVQSLAAAGVIVFVVGVLVTIFYSRLVTAHLYGTLYLDITREELRGE